MRVSRPLDLQEKSPRKSRVLTYFGYLYDGGVLLAIFDNADNVTQSYVNSPNGRVGVYWNNNDTLLYYFLTDHLGSTRVMVDRYGRVREYVNYDPFGEVLESWASYSEPMTFTGKQRDQHSTFDFYYFGSRYYDYRIGQFASVDKAGQFAGGYLYGGNNPMLGIDGDGNLFFLVPMLLASAYTAGASAVSYTAFTIANGTFGDYGWLRGFGRAVATGAISGSLSGGLGFIGGDLANRTAYSIMSNTASTVGANSIMGAEFRWGNLAGALTGSFAADGLLGDYKAISNSKWLNAAAEIGFSAAKGGVAGFVGGVVTDTWEQRQPGSLGSYITSGAIGGGASALYNQALYGLPIRSNNPAERAALARQSKEAGGVSTIFRTGGILGNRNVLGVTYLTRNAVVSKEGRVETLENPFASTFIHEQEHVIQQYKLGFSRMMMRISAELNKYGEVYTTPGTLEYQASQAERIYGPY